MPFDIFKKISENVLGVDIGTFSVKVVEISKFGSQVNLENYGSVKSYDFLSNPFRNFDEKRAVNIAVDDTVNAIKAILKEAKIESRKAIFSIPDFSTFFTWFSLPPLNEEEIPTAVEFEARKYVPVPLSEVTLDWEIIEKKKNKNGIESKILLAAVSNEIIKQYQEIASLCGLKLLALESEVFALSRIFSTSYKEAIGILVDFGATTTTINIVYDSALQRTYNLDLSGNDITKKLMDKFGIDNPLKAEEFKYRIGIKADRKRSSINAVVSEIMPFVEELADNIEKVYNDFYNTEKKRISKVFLSGGSSLLPGLKEFLFKKLGKEVIIMNGPLSVKHNEFLDSILEEKGVFYNVALGVAAREI